MGEREVSAFLTALAVERRVAASTQTLYTEVLGRPMGSLGAVPRARAPERLPVILTRAEVHRVLEELAGTYRLVGLLLYGAGLRLMEALTLRVKDVDFGRGELRIQRAKGAKDRVTVLPEAIRGPLAAHLEDVNALHDAHNRADVPREER